MSVNGEQVSLEREMRDRLPTSSSEGRGSGERAVLKGRFRDDVVVGRGGFFFRFFTGDGDGNDGSEYVALLRLTGKPSPPPTQEPRLAELSQRADDKAGLRNVRRQRQL